MSKISAQSPPSIAWFKENHENNRALANLEVFFATKDGDCGANRLAVLAHF
jgi:hypothetical protein